MAQDNRFECPSCESRCGRQYVSYDPLGYPVCPVCNAVTAPSETRDYKPAHG